MCGWFGHLHLLLQSNWSGGYDYASNAKAKMQMGHMGAKGSCTFLRCQISALHDWNESAFHSDARHEEWCSGARHALTSVLKGFYKGADLTKRLQCPRPACHQDNLIHCVYVNQRLLQSLQTLKLSCVHLTFKLFKRILLFSLYLFKWSCTLLQHKQLRRQVGYAF